MKNFIAIASIFVGAQALAAQSGRPDVYTTRFYNVKSDVTFEAAKKDFDALNPALAKIKGFEKRNLFYDKEQKVWIDQIKWKHIDAAKSGEKTLAGEPAFTNLSKISESKSNPVYQAERVTEYDAPK
jgi:hypothetical protein